MEQRVRGRFIAPGRQKLYEPIKKISRLANDLFDATVSAALKLSTGAARFDLNESVS